MPHNQISPSGFVNNGENSQPYPVSYMDGWLLRTIGYLGYSHKQFTCPLVTPWFPHQNTIWRKGILRGIGADIEMGLSRDSLPATLPAKNIHIVDYIEWLPH